MNVALPTFTFPLDHKLHPSTGDDAGSSPSMRLSTAPAPLKDTRSRRHRNDSGIALRALAGPPPSLTADKLAVQFAGAVTGNAPA